MGRGRFKEKGRRNNRIEKKETRANVLKRLKRKRNVEQNK